MKANIIKTLSVFILLLSGPFIVQGEDYKDEIIKLSYKVIKLLDEANFDKLGSFIHVKRGLRFSPYNYGKLTEIRPTKSPLSAANITRFSKKEIKIFLNDNKIYVWGNWDGSGEQIKLKKKEYYKRFIYDFNFADKTKPIYIPNRKTKKWKKKWREIKYVYKAYPNSEIILFKFNGTPETAFNDFKKLVLAFEKIESNWWLIAIVHGEKTI